MERCCICNKEVKNYTKVKNVGVMCQKHQHQWYEKGRIIDDSPHSCMTDLNEFIEYDTYYEIILRRPSEGYIEIGRTIIDKEDYNLCKDMRWRLAITRNGKRKEVVTGSPHKNNMISIYRLVMNAQKEDVVDHINGDTLDNRKQNLRICTQKDNIRNKTILPSNNTSGILGVYKDSRKQRKSNWIAEIKYNDVKIYLSAFVKFEDAVYCRYIAETLLFQEFRPTTHDENIKQYIDACANKTSIENKVKERIFKKLNIKL